MMRYMNKFLALTCILYISFLLSACGGSKEEAISPVNDNIAPIADAGTDQNLVTGTQVTLNGSESWDADGDVLTYAWTLNNKPAGSVTTISGATSAQAAFVVDLDGTYNASLVVNDGSVDSAPDLIVVTSSTINAAPVADAGMDMNVDTGSQITLNGSGSSDTDGDVLTYAWTLDNKPAGSVTTISGATSAQAAFVVDLDGTYNASLVVNDGSVDSAPDLIAVTSSTSNSAIPPRVQSPLSIRQIHSGHSLTDAAMFAQPWPGHSIHMWTELDSNGNYHNLLGKSTAPGSPMRYRWLNTVGYGQPEARYDIANWELLVITEGVPFPNWDDEHPNDIRDSINYLSLFAQNAWENGNDGAGASTLLFATWTGLQQGETQWRAELDTYKPLWEQMADYGAENLPDDAFIYIIPGNLLMMRLFDDIEANNVPGITSIHDFFDDAIHPNGLGNYALALMHMAVIHHVNPNVMGYSGYSLTPEPSAELAGYLQSVVWEIASDYHRAGLPRD
jgi:hypothetical protein